jgi:hypothetical protein
VSVDENIIYEDIKRRGRRPAATADQRPDLASEVTVVR